MGISSEALPEATLKDDDAHRIGILATQGTVDSNAYIRELKKIDSKIKIFQQAAPLLVPLIEANASRLADPILRSYLRPLLKKKIDLLILGCTHYPILKKQIREWCGKDVVIISQDEIISAKLVDYLRRHPEIEKGLNKNKRREFFVTDITPAAKALSKKWFKKEIRFNVIKF